MKIDRLLGITIYLLNRDVVSAKELCDRFEVSQRTVVRDIETLNMAGIPVTSSTGANGGYKILDTFKLNKHLTNTDDYRFIIAALKGLRSAVDNKKLNDTLEKLSAVNNPADPRFILDFGIVKEDGRINGLIEVLERAVTERRIVTFEYTRADGGTNLRTVEPLALNYKWYAWYLFAFCTYKKDYRLFKLKRMYELAETAERYEDRHGDVSGLVDGSCEHDNRRHYYYTLKCAADALVLVMEYLGGDVIERFDDGGAVLSIGAIDSDRLWFSLLLGFGDKVEVIEPEHLRNRLREASEKILNLYNH
jgi:predicted DNA-binding transcriptional regulator YafY